MAEGRGLIVAAPHSGSGKTLVTLGLLRALSDRGLKVAPAKTGPDYIDPAYLARAANVPCVNLDPWAMSAPKLWHLAGSHAASADLLLVEGVMGLFDGAAGGGGSTADLAATLGLPVVLVVDCSHQAQSVAALVTGFARYRSDVTVAGVVLNRVAGDKHERMLRGALADVDVHVFGVLRRNDSLTVPARHLGLTLPGEVAGADHIIDAAARAVAGSLDVDAMLEAAAPLAEHEPVRSLPPLGQRMAIARDAAFAFVYEHHLDAWHEAGAALSFFSPVEDEAPDPDVDAIYLPGGYPELHGPALESAARFREGLRAARDRGVLIYGECGGYMVLGQGVTTAEGHRHAMTGLLPLESRIDRPRRVLGYRRLHHEAGLPWGADLKGHEFHYSTGTVTGLDPLFAATDAEGNDLEPMGAVLGNVMGSYAHVIAEAG